MRRPLFPRWANRTRTVLAIALGVLPAYAIALASLAASPTTTDIGYMPVQPVPNNHALHVGQLGIDCRFCHYTVERAAHAALPDAVACQVCHRTVRAKSLKLEGIRHAAATSTPIAWVKVDDLPDFVFFDHRAHVTRGVACASCHGPVDRMDQIWQAETFSMAFCLRCHRNPEPALRPLDRVTSVNFEPAADPVGYGRELRANYQIQPSTDCSSCHR